MKKTRFFICGRVNGVISFKKDDSSFLTSIDGLYEVSSVVEKIYNDVSYYIGKVVDTFSSESVIRDVYLIEN